MWTFQYWISTCLNHLNETWFTKWMKTIMKENSFAFFDGTHTDDTVEWFIIAIEWFVFMIGEFIEKGF